MMGIVSVSLNKWFKENNIFGVEKVVACIPSNRRPYPTSLSDLQVGNRFVVSYVELPMKPELNEAIE